MYRELWNMIPLGTWGRVAVFAVAALIIVAVLMEVIFPWIGPSLIGSDASVG